MKISQLSLHALPEELLSFARSWMADQGFRAAVVRIAPEFSVVQVNSADDLRDEVARGGSPFRLCLGRDDFTNPASNLLGFMSKNRMECILDFGALTPDGLRESSIVASNDDGVGSRFWVAALKAVKATTKAGMWAVSPRTGSRKFMRSCRYTSGAAQFASSGRRLLPVAGWNFYEIQPE